MRTIAIYSTATQPADFSSLPLVIRQRLHGANVHTFHLTLADLVLPAAPDNAIAKVSELLSTGSTYRQKEFTLRVLVMLVGCRSPERIAELEAARLRRCREMPSRKNPMATAVRMPLRKVAL